MFVLPARMLEDKGVLEFVEAAKILKERGVQAIFRLLGNPDSHNPSSIDVRTLQRWKAEGLVEWLGYAEDMNSALARTHVCVLPSYMEGFPKTIIDAAAAGRMAVVTDVPGCRDAIVPGVTGLLCKVRDPLDLARVLETVAQDRDMQVRMGKQARLHAERQFDIQKVCEIHMALYKQQLQLKA